MLPKSCNLQKFIKETQNTVYVLLIMKAKKNICLCKTLEKHADRHKNIY